jgi:hypothetical protein
MTQNDVSDVNCYFARTCISVAAHAINCVYECYDIPGSSSKRYILRRIADNVAAYEMYTRISNNGSVRLAVKDIGCDKNRMVIKINSKKELVVTTYDTPQSSDDNKIIADMRSYYKYLVKGDD